MFRPLLAPNEDPLRYQNYFDELKYPLFVSPKYDGIRCIVKNGIAYSRSGKPIPSAQVQYAFKHLEHFDGELIVGDPTDSDVYNRTQSHVMSRSKPGDIKFYVFDYTAPSCLNWSFKTRLELLRGALFNNAQDNVFMVQQKKVMIYEELMDFEVECLFEGFEGIMMRDPEAPYKQGRGTWKEGIIYKLKRFQDDEAVIIGFKELMTNQNELKLDELGYAKRSSSKEGLVAGDTLGAFIVDYKGQELDIAPGILTHDDRKLIWENQEDFLEKMLKFRFFAHGIKDKPRFPRFIGFRNLGDL